ncbi:peptidoglycan-binding protein, partial [Streptomyces sp. SID339]
ALPAAASAEVGGHLADTGAGPGAGRAMVTADEEPGTPQGAKSPLHGRPATGAPGPPGGAAVRATTRAAIIDRAEKWVAAKVPYSMDAYWSDGYRQDCSGFVSMAWDLGGNEWTGSLDRHAVRIAKEQLQPGDILLFHNPADPEKGSHVTLFGGWTDDSHTHYVAYEQARPHARKQSTPYAYWTNANRYLAYRYKGKGVGGGTPGGPGVDDPYGTRPGEVPVPAYPGRDVFRPGRSHPAIERLGRQLVKKGFGRHYARGPGPAWSESDRRNVEAFQRAQGWRGAAADGHPGPETWRRLFR